MLHRNLTTKIFSLFLAVVLWCYLLLSTGNPVQERTWRARVGLQHTPAGLVGYITPDTVKLVVRGREQGISTLDLSRFKVFVEASGLAAGEHWMRVRTDQPEGVSLRVDPIQVKVMLERSLRRIMPIEFRLEGEPPPGYELGTPTGTPSMVNVFGPESKVDEVRRAVALINLARVTPGLAQSVPVTPLDVQGAKVEQAEVLPDHVTIRVPIKSVRLPRALPVVVETSGSPAPGYVVASVEVEPTVVTVIGPSDLVAQLRYVHTEVIPVGNLDHDQEVTARLAPPAGVATLDLAQVKVRFRVRPQSAGEERGSPN